MSVGTRNTNRSLRTRRSRTIANHAGTTLVRQNAAAGIQPSRLEVLASRLTPHEWRRRLIHMSPGVIPFVLTAIPHHDPVGWRLLSIVALLTLGLVVFALRREKLFARTGERGWATSVISYGLITTSLLLAFPAQLELGMVVMIIIALGDGSATLAGLIVRGRRLPWNQAKSWVGLTAFLVCGGSLATLAYWFEARPGVSPLLALTCVMPAVFAAALAESLPVRLNDNIRVGVTGGLAMLMTQSVLVGW
jgi:dolichol kinase